VAENIRSENHDPNLHELLDKFKFDEYCFVEQIAKLYSKSRYSKIESASSSEVC
jgi:hypothetical protein